MKIIFARHCETDWNARAKVQGRTDIPLNDKGRGQAAALAAKVAAEGVTRIIASDLSRAHETARIVGAALGVPVTTDARLRECSFGFVEGISVALFVRLFGGMKRRPLRKKLHYDFRLFGGEYGPLVAVRHLQAVFDVIRQGPSDATVMLVCHGRGMRTLFAALGIEDDDPSQGEYLAITF
ncbi:MAG TPA: histidine phosphatase family protein [Patescibacteria group bacterium]|nr:histidine phosphatase family protein [Patescibacteria group bacterium]